MISYNYQMNLHQLIQKAFPLLLCTCLFLMTTSCGDSACKGVNCGSHGACADGNCECDPGFETATDGTCSVRTAKKLTGVYPTTSKGCKTGSYSTSIQASNIHDDILLLVGLGSYLCSNGEPIVVEAQVDGPNAFKLEPGPYCNQYRFKGTGTLDGDKIVVSYTAEYEVNGSQVKDKCTATLER